MKVTVLQENLARGLSVVSKAVSPRSTLPVLANVLIASDEGRLRLSATNLEMGITCWIPARIDEEGSTTVPARTFVDLVSTLPSDQVLLKLDPQTQTLNVRGGTSTNDIKCIDAQEFPPLPVPDFDGAVQINVGDFREMIHQVVFAASSDEARPVLMGVLVQVDKDKLTMAAADGFRLSVRKAVLSTPSAGSVSAIVPAQALKELARVATDADEPIYMVLPKGRGQVVFRVKDVEVVSQLIDGTFPDYQQIIPRSYKSRTLVSTSSLLKACKQAEIFAREGSNVARFNIKTSQGAGVRAIYKGTVVSILSNPGYHKAVLVRHGEYFTVYSNLTSVNVKANQEIDTKQSIGTAYTDPSTGETMVHLEVWKGTALLNPESWIIER